MTNNKPINIRLTPAEQSKYEAQAASHNLPLRTYLRQKLAYSDSILEEITALKSIMSQGEPTNGNAKSQEFGILLEMLLLLRQLAQPKQVQLAQQEVKRLKLPVWGHHNPSG